MLFIFFAVNAGAQDIPISDTLQADTIHLTEQQLIQQQQQNKVDELIKAKLQKQIQLLSEDSKQKKVLEQQLQEIAIRDSIFKKDQQAKIDILRQTAKGYPVQLLRDTLFYIYTRLGSFNAAERASAVSTRLMRLYEDEFYNVDTLHLLKNDNGYDIVYNNDVIIMSVSVTDALYFNKTPEALGTQYLQKIKDTIKATKQANSLANWLRRVGYVALVILGILVIIYLINRLFALLSRYVIRKRSRYSKGLSIRGYKLFSPKQHLVFLLRSIRFARFIAVLLALYLSLPVLFSIFPQTEAYTYTLLNWIITPAKSVVHNILNYLPNLFTVLVIYLFTRYTIKGVSYLADEVEVGKLNINGFYSDWAKPTYNIIKFLLYAFMVIIVFPYLPGSGSPAFQGVSVFLGILFSIGSSSAIGNMVAGLVITYMRPFKVGDRVKIGDIAGDVLEKTMLVTRINTIKNEEVTVPNAMVLAGHTINYSRGAEKDGIIIHSTVTLGYDVPWKKVHETLLEAAARTEFIGTEPKPFVLQTGLEDFYVSYQINGYTRNPSRLSKIYSDLHQNIQDCCNEAGIEILSPHYRAMRDGNMTTIPENYLPENYVVPAFKVDQRKD